tara:strand:+ start:32 stop:667 length:636 start_codon:yes stop_codon:yes gene_type:complete
MTGIVIPDGGTIGSTSDTDAITISSTGKVTTADSELNVKTTSHTFTVKGIDEAISDSQSGTSPDTTDSDSGQFAVYNGSIKLFGITEHGYVSKPKQPMFYATNGNSGNPTAYSTVSQNIGNHFDGTYFTAPVTGTYLFELTCGSASSYGMDIQLNSSGISRLEHTNPPGFSWNNVSVVTRMQAGDYVHSSVFKGSPSQTAGYAGFSGSLLG